MNAALHGRLAASTTRHLGFDRSRRRLLPILITTLAGGVCYFVVARLSLLLAIPVGYASLLWPATGIAILLILRGGPVAIGGIAIGAALAHLGGAADGLPDAISPKVAIAASLIGVCLALQAACGAVWLHRLRLNPVEDDSLAQTLGGAAAIALVLGLLHAVAVTAVVFGFGLVREFSPWTFALVAGTGDALGTLCLMPILLLTGVSPAARLKTDVSLRPALILMLLLAVSGWLVTAAMHRLILRDEQKTFAAQSRMLISAMREKATEDLLLLDLLRGLIEVNPGLSREEFGHFATVLVAGQPQLQGIGLVRHLFAAQRAVFEQSRAKQLGRPIPITAIGPDNTLVPAPPDTDYYVVDYGEPSGPARTAIGFDLSSEPRHDQAMQQARSSGRPAASARLQLASELESSSGIVVMQHVAAGAGTPQAIDGFVALTLRMDRWFKGLLPQMGNLVKASTIEVQDITDTPAETLIQLADGQTVQRLPEALSADFTESTDLDFQQRRWRVVIALPAHRVGLLEGPNWWTAQILPQLLVTILLGTLLLAISQTRIRDRLEMQVGALSRRFLNSLDDAAPAAPPLSPQISSQRDAECAAVWDAHRTRQFYEPIVDLRDGYLVGFESLLRIPGMAAAPRVPDFIAWAERTGRIKELTQRSIGQALVQIEQFQAHAGRSDVPWISVNVSALDLGDEAFIDCVMALARIHRRARYYLKLEVTESVLVQDVALVASRLQLLRSTGIRIALDDFGTGYASLSYLHQLPLDTLKIDRSFIARVDSDSAARDIVSAMVMLARKLGLDVIAEGIEDASTAKAALRFGCTLAQGYRFAQASPADTVLEWVRSRRRFPVA